MDFKYLEIEKKENLAWIRMNSDPLNNMDIPFMQELAEAHRQMDQDDSVWGVLLGSKSEKFFSNGINPAMMLERDIDGRAEVFSELFEMINAMYGFSKPEISVINGHAMAGGAVLGILTDFRFMNSESGRYGFSEVAVGLTIPKLLMGILESVVGPQNLIQTTMVGRNFRGPEALAINLVDQVHTGDVLEAQAEKYMKELFRLPQASMRSIKAYIRGDIMEKVVATRKESEAGMREFLTGNFEEGLRAVHERRRPKFVNP